MSILKYANPNNYRNKFRRLYQLANYKLGREVIVDEVTNGHSIRFKTSNDIEFLMRAKGSYVAEKTTMEWINNHIGPDDVVFDIGANVGAYSLLIGKKMQSLKGKGQVLCFEPESHNFLSLNKNIHLNALSDRVLAIPMAIGDKINLGRFHVRKFTYGAATHGLYEAKSEGISFTPEHIQGIIVMSVDNFIALDGVPFPRHIKIDVDGLETVIVKNMKKTLADARLKTIVIEIAEAVSHGAIEKDIESYGFHRTSEETMQSQSGTVYNIFYSRA